MISRQSFNGPFLTSVAAITVAAIVLLSNVPSLFSAIFWRGDSKSDPAAEIATLIEEHKSEFETYQARFAGRSVFYHPPPPPPPPRAHQPQRDPPPPPPPPPPPAGPPPPPATYGGPGIFAIFSDEAWFKGRAHNDKTIRLRIGEEYDGVKLISTDPPRGVRVEWSRGEYNVPLFPWDMPFLVAELGERAPMPGLISAGDLRRSDVIIPVADPSPEEIERFQALQAEAELRQISDQRRPARAEDDLFDGLDPDVDEEHGVMAEEVDPTLEEEPYVEEPVEDEPHEDEPEKEDEVEEEDEPSDDPSADPQPGQADPVAPDDPKKEQ